MEEEGRRVKRQGWQGEERKELSKRKEKGCGEKWEKGGGEGKGSKN